MHSTHLSDLKDTHNIFWWATLNARKKWIIAIINPNKTLFCSINQSGWGASYCTNQSTGVGAEKQTEPPFMWSVWQSDHRWPGVDRWGCRPTSHNMTFLSSAVRFYVYVCIQPPMCIHCKSGFWYMLKSPSGFCQYFYTVTVHTLNDLFLKY